MTAAEMHRALETMGVMGVVPYDGGGYAGVRALCPVCAPGTVIWTEQTRKWVCDKPDCRSRKNPSLIVDKFDEQHPQIGGFANGNGNGNGHQNGRVVAPSANGRVEPNPTFPFPTAPREAGKWETGEGGGFTSRKLNPATFRPTRWAWRDRLVVGALNILVGEEGVGKGTMLSWLIAQLTKGALPGDLRDKPARVLWVGDEDSWDEVVGPRLYAAGVDSDRVEDLIHPADALYNARDDAAQLDRVLKAGEFNVVVFEALLDHMPAAGRGDPMQHVRASLAPTRAVLRRRSLTALATMHTKKGTATSFRELMAGSHQFNALSRSSLLLATHPDDADRRIVVAGKQNYSRAAVTQSFELVGHSFTLNGEQFSVSLAQDFRVEDAITIDGLLSVNRDSPVVDDLADQVRLVLTREPQQRSVIAKAVDRSDGTLDRALEALAKDGTAQKAGRGLWQLAPQGSVA